MSSLEYQVLHEMNKNFVNMIHEIEALRKTFVVLGETVREEIQAVRLMHESLYEEIVKLNEFVERIADKD